MIIIWLDYLGLKVKKTIPCIVPPVVAFSAELKSSPHHLSSIDASVPWNWIYPESQLVPFYNVIYVPIEEKKMFY